MKYLIFFSFIINSYLTSAAEWPEMSFPRNVRVNIVSESMIFNGLPMKTWVINSENPAEQMVSFYRDTWKPKKNTWYDEQVIDGWTYINSKQDGFVLTAKIGQSLGQAQGYLGISHFDERIKDFKPGKGFPLPRGSIVVNDITEKDIGKTSRYLLFSTQQTLSDTFDYYLNQYAKQGWQATTAMIDKQKTDAVIALSKGGDEINLSIHKLNTMTQVSASLVNKTIL